MFAMKATNVVINGEEKPIYKDPKTDNGLKKSLKGRIGVFTQNGEIIAVDNIDLTIGENKKVYESSLLKTVWKDGEFVKRVTFDEVRANAGAV